MMSNVYFVVERIFLQKVVWSKWKETELYGQNNIKLKFRLGICKMYGLGTKHFTTWTLRFFFSENGIFLLL